MDSLYNQKVININNVFDDRFLDTKILFLHCFNVLPSLNFINQVDGEKAFNTFSERYKDNISRVHRYRWYKLKKKNYQFDRTVVIMKSNCIIEFDDDYCEIKPTFKKVYEAKMRNPPPFLFKSK